MTRFKKTMLILGFLFLFTFLLSISWGSYQIPINRFLAIFSGNATPFEQIAVFSIRLPRILTAMVVGIALACAGNILQTVTKNELADTGIIGLNAGAALAAVFFIGLLSSDYYSNLSAWSIYLLPFVSLIGASIASLLVYILAHNKGKFQTKKLLLLGLGISMGINAFITFYTFKGSVGEYNRILVWISGSLWGSGWQYFLAVMPIILPLFLFILYRHKTLDVLNLGEEVATGLGVPVEKRRRELWFCATILAAAATAVAGNIAFLGLIAPNIAKAIIGPKHKHSLLSSALIAMILILLADTIARNAFSPLEIPVGIIISLIGVPYFIYLMMKEQ